MTPESPFDRWEETSCKDNKRNEEEGSSGNDSSHEWEARNQATCVHILISNEDADRLFGQTEFLGAPLLL